MNQLLLILLFVGIGIVRAIYGGSDSLNLNIIRKITKLGVNTTNYSFWKRLLVASSLSFKSESSLLLLSGESTTSSWSSLVSLLWSLRTRSRDFDLDDRDDLELLREWDRLDLSFLFSFERDLLSRRLLRLRDLERLVLTFKKWTSLKCFNPACKKGNISKKTSLNILSRISSLSCPLW